MQLRVNIFAIFIIFFVLKLCGVIAWSWVWVLSPLWLPIAFCIAVFCGVAVIAGIGVIFGWRFM